MIHCSQLLRALLVATCLLVGIRTSDAATFDVDDTAFLGDSNPGDGVCASANATCTLWAAVDEANALAGRDTINLPAGNYLTEPDTYGHVVSIRDDLDLIGAGAEVTFIDANRPVDPPWFYIRVIALEGGKSATVSGVTIRNGSTGVDNYGDLTLSDCIVTNAVGQSTHGGGIENRGTLRVVRSRVVDNPGKGIYATGSYYHDLPAPTFTEIRESIVANNGSHGVTNTSEITTAEMAVIDSFVAGNKIGVYNTREFGSAILTISGSTIKDNRDWGVRNTSRTVIINSTVTGNSTEGIWACGGISNDGHLVANNVTVTANRGQGIDSSDSGDGPPVGIVRNSIVWGNLPLAGWHHDCDAINSAGNNLIGTASLETILDASDLVGVDPLLGPLQDNGGATPTYALLDGSPALEGDGRDCEQTDQRGVPRPQGAACDIGAYERIACNYDGNVDGFEDCDDGNTADGDGCSSLCETELLSGAAMLMRSSPDDLSTAKVGLSSKDSNMTVGWGNFSADDPVIHGGRVRLHSSANGFDTTLDLPAENWSYFGRPGMNKGYRYKAATGSITSVLVRNGKVLKVKGGGAALGYSLEQSPDPIAAEVTLGDRHFYMEFGGEVRFTTDRSFKARNAPAPAAPPM